MKKIIYFIRIYFGLRIASNEFRNYKIVLIAEKLL